MRHTKKLFLWITCLVVLLALAVPTAAQDDPPVDQLEIISEINTGLTGGPVRTGAFLAPSGEMFAHITGTELCLYSALSGEQESCTPLGENLNGRIENDNVRWSPDGRYLVLPEETLRTFRDPDLHVYDTTTGSLTNITDDGYIGKVFVGEVESPVWMDLSPRWTPDGQILFLRVIHEGSTLGPTILYRIAPDGTGLEKLTEMPGERLQVYWFNLSPDGSRLVYYFDMRDEQDAYWLYTCNLDGSDNQPVMQSQFPFTNATFSPDGRYLLTLDARLGQYALNYTDPQQSPVQLLDLETQQVMLADEAHFALWAGWAPEGHALSYVTRGLSVPDSALYLSTEPGQPGHKVLEGMLYPPTSFNRAPIPWGANNVILITNVEDSHVRVLQLGMP